MPQNADADILALPVMTRTRLWSALSKMKIFSCDFVSRDTYSCKDPSLRRFARFPADLDLASRYTLSICTDMMAAMSLAMIFSHPNTTSAYENLLMTLFTNSIPDEKVIA